MVRRMFQISGCREGMLKKVVDIEKLAYNQ